MKWAISSRISCCVNICTPCWQAKTRKLQPRFWGVFDSDLGLFFRRQATAWWYAPHASEDESRHFIVTSERSEMRPSNVGCVGDRAGAAFSTETWYSSTGTLIVTSFVEPSQKVKSWPTQLWFSGQVLLLPSSARATRIVAMRGGGISTPSVRNKANLL